MTDQLRWVAMWENVEEQRKRREALRLSHVIRHGAAWRWALAASMVGLVVSIGVGSWWTARSIADGLPVWTFVRFVLTVAVGTYYLVWFNNARAARAARATVLANDRANHS